MSSPSEPQYGRAVQRPSADETGSQSVPGTPPAEKLGERRIPRLKLTRIALDRKISPYFAT